jgi:hypothetical protein
MLIPVKGAPTAHPRHTPVVTGSRSATPTRSLSVSRARGRRIRSSEPSSRYTAISHGQVDSCIAAGPALPSRRQQTPSSLFR